MKHSRSEMYSGHSRLCVCLSVLHLFLDSGRPNEAAAMRPYARLLDHLFTIAAHIAVLFMAALWNRAGNYIFAL